MTNIFHQKKYAAYLAIALIVFFSSCKKFVEGESNDEELITTIRLTFSNGSNTQSFEIKDIDGPGGNPPLVDSIILSASNIYNVSVELLNEAAVPAEDITAEVEEENEAHRFYFGISPGTLIQVGQLNADDSGISLGTTSQWTTNAVGAGAATVTLRHYPGTPPDKQESDPVSSPKSSTDVEVVFPVRIQ